MADGKGCPPNCRCERCKAARRQGLRITDDGTLGARRGHGGSGHDSGHRSKVSHPPLRRSRRRHGTRRPKPKGGFVGNAARHARERSDTLAVEREPVFHFPIKGWQRSAPCVPAFFYGYDVLAIQERVTGWWISVRAETRHRVAARCGALVCDVYREQGGVRLELPGNQGDVFISDAIIDVLCWATEEAA